MLKQTPIYETLTFDQKKRLWDYLVSIGLPLNPPAKPRKASKRSLALAADRALAERVAAIEAWKPETSAGRKCKANMLYWLNSPKAKPNYTADVLAMFGVRLGDVSPWPEGGPNQRGQMLANAIGKGVLALPKPVNVLQTPHWYADAAAPFTIHTTTTGRRSYRQMNQV